MPGNLGDFSVTEIVRHINFVHPDFFDFFLDRVDGISDPITLVLALDRFNRVRGRTACRWCGLPYVMSDFKFPNCIFCTLIIDQDLRWKRVLFLHLSAPTVFGITFNRREPDDLGVSTKIPYWEQIELENEPDTKVYISFGNDPDDPLFAQGLHQYKSLLQLFDSERRLVDAFLDNQIDDYLNYYQEVPGKRWQLEILEPKIQALQDKKSFIKLFEDYRLPEVKVMALSNIDDLDYLENVQNISFEDLEELIFRRLQRQGINGISLHVRNNQYTSDLPDDLFEENPDLWYFLFNNYEHKGSRFEKVHLALEIYFMTLEDRERIESHYRILGKRIYHLINPNIANPELLRKLMMYHGDKKKTKHYQEDPMEKIIIILDRLISIGELSVEDLKYFFSLDFNYDLSRKFSFDNPDKNRYDNFEVIIVKALNFLSLQDRAELLPDINSFQLQYEIVEQDGISEENAYKITNETLMVVILSKISNPIAYFDFMVNTLDTDVLNDLADTMHQYLITNEAGKKNGSILGKQSVDQLIQWMNIIDDEDNYIAALLFEMTSLEKQMQLHRERADTSYFYAGFEQYSLEQLSELILQYAGHPRIIRELKEAAEKLI